MNVITRGVRGALRSPIRSGAIILMLAVSIGLMLAMLVAKSSIDAKINEVKASTATQITINPAGVMGGLGSGNYLTADQLNAITSTAHITKTSSSLTDQAGTNDTSLTPSLELGSFGKRQMRFESHEGSGSKPLTEQAAPQTELKPRTPITGTNDPQSIADKGTLGGELFDGNSTANEAVVGKKLADKNSLSVGSTFTAYGQTITVKGILTTNNGFQDNGLLVPLKTLQTLTSQPDAVSTTEATVDSSDNVAGVVSALKNSLGDKADVTSQQEQAENSLKPLENIAGLALGGVVGAAVAGAVIIFLVMIIIVRERRREIGVIKAIGGTNVKIIVQFITEALTLIIIAGAIGLAVGAAASGPLTQSLADNQSNQPQAQSGKATIVRRDFGGEIGKNLTTVTSTLTPQVFAGSIGIILFIAIIGSAIPAWTIARVRPSETLRTE